MLPAFRSTAPDRRRSRRAEGTMKILLLMALITAIAAAARREHTRQAGKSTA
jgi:hypothetical protein